MASDSIISWQIEGEKVEAVTDFLFLSSKITADDDCNHEIRRQLLLGRKAMTNLDSVLKNKDVTLPTKVHIVKAKVFPTCGSAGKESACNAGDLGSIPGLGRSPGEEKGYPLQYSGLENSMDCMVHGVPKGGFPHSSVGKESACSTGDLGSTPGLGRSPGEGNGNPLQYSCLENPMDRGAWQAIVHGVVRV